MLLIYKMMRLTIFWVNKDFEEEEEIGEPKEQAKLELKPLPSNLWYEFLDTDS